MDDVARPARYRQNTMLAYSSDFSRHRCDQNKLKHCKILRLGSKNHIVEVAKASQRTHFCANCALIVVNVIAYQTLCGVYIRDLTFVQICQQYRFLRLFLSFRAQKTALVSAWSLQ